VLTDGINHVAVLTADMERLIEFYRAMFDAEVAHEEHGEDGVRFCIVDVGHLAELNVFQIDGNTEAAKQTPMFGRGRLDHLALRAPDLASFEEIRRRLRAAGAADGFVTDFGPVLSLFFRDPDGLEAEVVVANPDAVRGVFHGPGHPAARYAGDAS
jgi:catechol 2,3-dioxygenase-like lactoylglutathione lyase family enzyme